MLTVIDKSDRTTADSNGLPDWKPQARLRPPLLSSSESSDFDALVDIISRRIKSVDKARSLTFALLNRYKHLAGVLTATEESLRGELSVPEKLIQDIKRYHTVAMKLLRQPIENEPVFASSTALHTYLYARMAHLSVEHIRVLFLNNHYRLIRDELLQTGSPNHVPVQISEIVKKALLYDSKKMIIVHNHPSGHSEPSPGDISLTEQLNIASNLLGIELVDHLIIGRLGSVSLRLLGHL
jgi:DNA repair protein RadC